MVDLIQRLRKYLPLSSAAAAKGIGDFTSNTTGVAPVGIIMWNLIVNDILKVVKSGKQSLNDLDFKASRQSLLDEIDQLIFWCKINNLTPSQVSERLAVTVVSIASRHVQQYKIGPQTVGEAKTSSLNEHVKRESSCGGIATEIMDRLPQVMKTSQCQMGNDGMFIEALLTPLAAALVANEVNGPEKALGFKIWQFIILSSNSAVRNHGLYFLPLMIRYGEWLQSLPYENKVAFAAMTAEQSATYMEILRQILLCVHAMAVREDPTDSIMHVIRTNERGEDEGHVKVMINLFSAPQYI